MAIPVRLKVFEGPLDLLLHLIDKNKVDIYDIPISMIAEQYLHYIGEMKRNDMNVMSEFLVMAATLLDIKCRMLLPKEVNGEGEEEDPRAELVERLIEYKMYKCMSYELRDRRVDAEKSLYKPPTVPSEVSEYMEPIDYEQLVGEATLLKLHHIFQYLIKRQKDKIDPVRSKFGKIEKEEISLENKLCYVTGYAKEHRTFSFSVLLGERRGRMEMVVTFLAVLELMRTGTIKIVQENLFDDILISYVEAA